MRRIIPLLLGLTALAGCTVGPNFEQPPAPRTTTYRPTSEARAAAPAEPAADLGVGPEGRWWETFGSADLNALVEQALAHNYGLAAADATLRASDAEARAIAGRRLPQVDANARVEQEEVNLQSFGFSGIGGVSIANPEFHLYSVGGGISYDLDLFGGLRRQEEQGFAQAESQRRQAEAARLAVAGRVVGQVLTIAAIARQIDVADALLADDQRNVDLVTKRQQAGEGTMVEVLNAQAQFTADRGDIPQLRQQYDEARHLLATLVGIAPADLGPTDLRLETLTLPTSVPVTLPSALVHKRPDILQAEADLHAATAAIGVATAKLYPDITLGATLEQGTPSAGNLLKNAFRGYDIFAGLAAPIFHGGTLKAERAAAVDRAHAAAATYQQTVLDAFGQVADLLSALQSDARSVSNQRESVTVAQRSLALSRRSFQVGNSGVLQVLDSERLYQRANTDLVLAQTRQYLNIARLYVATAGGWSGHIPAKPSEQAGKGLG
ncbi:efflux transporter outer membrane subunit [Sphingomonas sp. CGMCC 1.13654]|uniref:Efflux transporter outer membrane subunit n=1 Tax=Sphingomonas chungangi TaxID=2683589 RepID=A0A838KZC7_9SPHN|nr:efflux transporter outer membrane subunit [Sphingomonas chungangi]MBA2932613.1 efflux transporter outer membrane subunit [Sphingomonas chungangi]MVW56236.1 efflux transporter outer membrane subunit [Sphingomonas chungangi]